MLADFINRHFRASIRFGRLLILFLASNAAFAQDDVITMVNGDRLSGEVKSLDRGMINFDTDATDTIAIRWDHVSDLTSPQSFLITLSNGSRLFGSIAGVDADNAISLTTNTGQVSVQMVELVRMSPIEARLVDQIDMNVDLGYSIAKANNVVQTTAGYDFSFRNEERLVSMNSDFARSSSVDRPDSLRANVAVSYRRFIEGRIWSRLDSRSSNAMTNSACGAARR